MEKIRSETAIETEENANNLLVSLDSQESQIRSRLKNPEDENWLRRNLKKVTMAMTLIAGPAILIATEGCGRNNPTGAGAREQQSAGPGNNLPSQNIEQQPSRTIIREINGENGIKIHIYSDNTYDVEQPEQPEEGAIVAEEGEQKTAKIPEPPKPLEQKPTRKKTSEDPEARKQRIHEMAERARADLSRQVDQKKTEELSEDEKAFRRDPRPNTLRQQDWNDRHRGPTN